MFKDFEIKNLRKRYDFYVQSDTLWLGDVFKKFQTMCLEKYARFLTEPGLACQAALKKTKTKLRFI